LHLAVDRYLAADSNESKLMYCTRNGAQ